MSYRITFTAQVKEVMDRWSISQIKDRLNEIENEFDNAPHIIDRDTWKNFYKPMEWEKLAILELYPHINM